MRSTIVRNLESRFAAYIDLAEQTDDKALLQKLDIEKHKSLAEHLWCIVGARESYAKALVAGDWQGFSCSLSEYSQFEIQAKLRQSANDCLAAIESVQDWTDARDELLSRLAEHEVMHEGQIIRHLLGAQRATPTSFQWA